MSAALMANGDNERARDAALQAIVRDPDLWPAWANFFVAETALGGSAEPCLLVEALRRHAGHRDVVEALAPLVHRIPADAKELLTIARLLVDHGHVQLGNRLVMRSTHGGAEWTVLALRCAHLLEDDAGVSRLAHVVLAKHPNDVDALRALAELALRHGMDTDASVIWERLMTLDAAKLDQLMLAWALARTGRVEEAEAVARLVHTTHELRPMELGSDTGAAVFAGTPETAPFAVRVATLLVPAAISRQRMAIALMATEVWANAVAADIGARALVRVALEMEAKGATRHALAALLMAERRCPGTVSDEDAGRIGAAARSVVDG